MRFLSNGDYVFPFEWLTYWAKHFYIWSFQTGTPNPDGIIRLPGRILNFIVFGLFGHEAVAYFYAISSLVIAFIAFFFFCKKFLKIEKTSVQVLGALFFAINPIFLGNLAKVGLVLAAALLPLSLVFIKLAFERRQLRYFVFYSMCLNLSFLHPYTLIVNVVVSGSYLLYMAWKHRQFVRENIKRLLGLLGLIVLANSYLILGLMSMGSVSKDVISANVVPVALDYTALVGMSNTGDLLTGLSLSKQVFLDFFFYDANYQTWFFIGIFSFYAILIVLYLRLKDRLSRQDFRRIGIFSAGFLALIALATTTIWNIDSFIKLMISMPGGWAFRSPLKWQLYIPFVLFAIAVLLLNRLQSQKSRRYAIVGLLVTFVLMNGFILLDVHKRLFTPRSFETFSALRNENINNKTLLFVNSPRCMEYLSRNIDTTTELNQVFAAANLQVKRVLIDSLASVNAGSYNFVLTCREKPDLATILQKKYNLAPKHSFANNSFVLYENPVAMPPVYAPAHIQQLSNIDNIQDKFPFVRDTLKQHMAFIDASQAIPATRLQNPFETISEANIKDKTIHTKTDAALSGTKQELLIPSLTEPLYYKISDRQLDLSATPKTGFTTINASRALQRVPLPTSELSIRYSDDRFAYRNLVKNGSLEEGLWQKKVSDCYNYDNQPDIAMQLNRNQATEGKQSLQLESKAHVACTGPQEVRVKGGQQFIISFKYLSPDGPFAGFYVRFNDADKTELTHRIKGPAKKWATHGQTIAIPAGATSMKIMLYAYPNSVDGTRSKVLYDDLSAIEMPAIQNTFFIVKDDGHIEPPKELRYTIEDPTKKTVFVRSSNKPFYIAINETYSPLWHLAPQARDTWLPGGKQAVQGITHFKLNNTMNAWLVEPTKLCAQSDYCKKNTQGELEMQFTLRFSAQKWFYVGVIISALASVALAIYCVREFLQNRKKRRPDATL